MTGLRVIASLLFTETPTISRREAKGQYMVPRGTINTILPGYLVNKCNIIPNSIRDYNTKDRHIICSPCLLLLSVGFGMLAQHRKNAENFEFINRVSSNAKRGLKFRENILRLRWIAQERGIFFWTIRWWVVHFTIYK